MTASPIDRPAAGPRRRSLVVSLGLLAVVWLVVAASCKPEDACLSSGKTTPKKYENCQRLCAGGNTKACDQRTALESDLSQLCHLRSKKTACRAMCHGRLHDQTACKVLRSLP